MPADLETAPQIAADCMTTDEMAGPWIADLP